MENSFNRACQPFTYELPSDRIAERPIYPYHDARLLVADRNDGSLRESTFIKLTEFLRPSDILILNNTRVIPARLFGRLETSGEVEILLLADKGENCWRVLGRPLKKFRPGGKIIFSDVLKAEVIERLDSYEALLSFYVDSGSDLSVPEALKACGLMPIPPYIRGGRGDMSDVKDYQSQYAKEEGSVAAPTASLHFTEELHKKLSLHGCRNDFITLHLSTASFLPVFDREEQGLKEPGVELLRYTPEVLKQAAIARKSGGRVIAVGTSVVRALETLFSMYNEHGDYQEGAYYETELFITPGYSFKVVDAMVTNFHQPGTTHMLMLQAFMEGDLLKKSYEVALSGGYRFLSYGDGMLIL